MLETWRWYGPHDPVSLSDIRQAGAQGIVTALHHIPNGQIWPIDEILLRKQQIEDAGLMWSVVESIPVHEDIKRRSGEYLTYIENYKSSIRNLGECDVKTICYNFMPVLDWTRTNLSYSLPDGSKALRFSVLDLAIFELYILERPGARESYDSHIIKQAESSFREMSQDVRLRLTKNILAGLPGSEEGYTLGQFQEVLDTYKYIDKTSLKENLIYFLQEIIPQADSSDVRMCLHPDDPPFPILGLPRVMSTLEDYKHIFTSVKSLNNGITFCTGSLGVRSDNDLSFFFESIAERIHFLHLRNTQRSNDGSFHEAAHLSGDTDMYEILRRVFVEQTRRASEGRRDSVIPMRPDHGHQMLDDLTKHTNPGYSAIGRLRGLAELRGLFMGIKRSMT